MRTLKVSTDRRNIKAVANGLLKGSGLECKFKNGVVSDDWFHTFAKRWEHELSFKFKKKHELQRKRWTAAKNMEDFYTVLEGVLLETGIAKLNPSYDSSVVWSKDMSPEQLEQCCSMEIVKPELLASTDETEATTNQSGGSTMARDNKILCANEGFNDWLCNKTSQGASMYSGSFASGKSLRQFAIFNCGQQIQWIICSPKSNIKNATIGLGHRT
eukprot:3163186-Rhodomonas_salina.1